MHCLVRMKQINLGIKKDKLIFLLLTNFLIFGFYSFNPAFSNETPFADPMNSQGINELSEISASQNPDSNNDDGMVEDSCVYNVHVVIPYFIGSYHGTWSAQFKKAQWRNIIKGMVSERFSQAINFPGVELNIIADEELIFLDSNYLGNWNNYGFGKIYYPNGNYFGVALNEDGLDSIYEFVQPIKNQHKDEIILILVDGILYENGNSSVPAFYFPLDGYIALAFNLEPNIQDFEFQGSDPFTHPFGVSEDLAHEIGHSFGLGHWMDDDNLMFPLSFPYSIFQEHQSCQVRRMCFNPSLMYTGDQYGIITDSDPEFSCGNNRLELTYADVTGNDLFEEVENRMVNLNPEHPVPFNVNCQKANPGISYNFSSEQKTIWGGRTTPYAAYFQLPGTTGEVNQCKVREFCGNEFIEPILGEQCDPESDEENHGCQEGLTCGGAVRMPNEEVWELKCNCVCPLDQHPEPEPCICCEDGKYCAQECGCCDLGQVCINGACSSPTPVPTPTPDGSNGPQSGPINNWGGPIIPQQGSSHGNDLTGDDDCENDSLLCIPPFYCPCDDVL